MVGTLIGTDKFTPEKRSKIMFMVKGKNTRPEMIVRSTCHKMGLRYRLHRKDLPGTPDLVFPKHRVCLFVHGCFWHRHPGCRRATTPKSRVKFWLPKLAKNVERDKAAQQALKTLGWRVAVVWECHTKNLKSLLRKFSTQ